jgi:DNA-binding MarR family transcriptional regulator
MNKTNLSAEEIRDLYRLHVSFKQTFEAIYKFRVAELKKFGITTEQVAALIPIKIMGEKATPSEVAGWIFREPPSTLNLLRRMQKQGLINMTRDSHNKHIIRLNLTPKGNKAYRNAFKYASVAQAYSCLSKKEQQQLWSLLDTLRERALKNIKMDAKSVSRLTVALMLPFTDTEDIKE